VDNNAGRKKGRQEVKEQKLILTHFYPECDKVDIKMQCRRTSPGPLVLGGDLMKVCLAAKSTKYKKESGESEILSG